MATQNGGSRKVGRHARVVVKDTILRDESGAVMTHKALFARLISAGDKGIHGTPQKKAR
jgi:hypothetical protein